MTYEEAIKNLERPSTIHGDAIRMAVEALEKQSEIVHCRDCKYWTKGTLEGLNRTLQVPACKLAGWLCAEDGFCMHGERNVE